MADQDKYLGIDVGGSFIKFGIVGSEGSVLCRDKVSADSRGDCDVLEIIVRGVREFCVKSGIEMSSLHGTGVSAPGCIDYARGVIANNGGNVHGWAHADVCGTLTKELGLPVVIENDGNCAVLGEAWTGAAKGCADVVCMTLGTGVGGGIISGGRLIRGRLGYAGEIGHFPVRFSGESGDFGFYENFASTSALIRKAMKIDAGLDSGHRIFERLDAGSAAVAEAVDEWLDEVACGVAGLVHIFNPEIVLIGGGVSERSDIIIEPLKSKVMNMIMPDFADGLEIRAAELGNDAGIVGAVRNFLNESSPGCSCGF